MKTHAELVAIARAHAEAEGRNEVRSFELRSEWVNEHGVGQEYLITLRTPDGETELHPVIGILTFGSEALSGERVWASERLLRLMFGPAFDLTEPL